mgnify:CR=1 FL=1
MNKGFRKLLLTLLLTFSVILAVQVIASNTTTEGKITVNKEATKDIGVDGNETYGRTSNVTLSVTGNSFTTTSSLDVVLVIDRSGSMNSKANRNDRQTKMQASKSSAINLATALLANNANGKNAVNMGIVTFGSDVIETDGSSFNSTRLTSTELTYDVNTITTMINAIPDSVGEYNDNLGSQGTNIQSGLERAKNLLAGSTANNKVVILLTDGEPTYFNYNGTRYGNGSSDSWTCIEYTGSGWNRECTQYKKPSEAALEEANYIKNANATIYTIGVGLGTDTTTTTFLQDVASSAANAYLANNEEELLSNFNDIVKSMTIVANNIVVEDIVPVGFVVDEELLKSTYGDSVSTSNNEDGTTTITWNIDELRVTNDQVLTYQVTAKEEYYGAMYTNEQAILTGDATSGNPSYPNGNIEEVFPLPIVAIPKVTNNDNYTAKLGSTLEINATNGISKNDSNIKLTDGNSTVRDEIIIKSVSCGNINDIVVNNDGSFTYTPDSSCYKNNNKVVFEYVVKSIVTIDNVEYEVISNTSTITIDLTKDNSNIEDPTVTKTSTNGDTTTSITNSFNYVIKYNTTINNHVGSSIVTIIDKLDYELDLTKENNLDGGVYDSTNKTITWTITIDDIDSYKNENNYIDIEKNITIYYKDIPTDVEKIINTVNVSTNIDNKTVGDTEEIEVVRGSLLVEYIDNKGNNLLDNITSEGLIDTTYTTSANNTIIVNNQEYKLVATRVNNEEIELTNNYSNKYKEDKTTVTYVYYKITGDIDKEQTVFTKDGTDKITTSDSSFEYNISYQTKINNYIGDATVTIIDYLPYKLDLSLSDLDGGVYNEEDLTITWEVVITNINTYTNGIYKFNLEKNLVLSYKDIDLTSDVITNKVEVNIKTDVSEENTDDEISTEVNVNGKVIVNYVDEEGNLLEETVILAGKVGSEYQTEEKIFDDYILTNIEGEIIGKYTEEEQVVTYIYTKIGKGGDVEELPPQTGDNNNFLINTLITLIISISLIIKKLI